MRPRSLVIDLYANYIRYRGGVASVQTLVGLLDRFGVGEETARVTLSRLKRQGWLATERRSRSSWYRLTPLGVQELDEGRERIFTRHGMDPWDGRWSLVIYQVPEAERQVRQWLRTRLQWLGFGPLGPATWVSPHDRLRELEEAMAAAEIEAQVDLLDASTGSLARDRELARRCWDLEEVAEAYQRFVTRYQPRIERYEAGEFEGAEALIEHIELVAAYRKFPFSDPDLPRELLPTDWIGTTAHTTFLQGYELLKGAAMAYYDEVADPAPAAVARVPLPGEGRSGLS
ncbi:PaaX family transcriptional regulator C-terminal domain-containing protein [Nitriliruptor alkaliphilus]|uniref:PaaX family transcriptional regulator C-terminal domain-containing protein n=1 Tax=Nitriliruptor alkaliphilus TaxID=427918 RepID=UPI0009F83591